MPLNPAKRLDAVQPYYFSKKLAEIAALHKTGKEIINLGIGSPDLPPHHDVITALNNSALNIGNHGYQSYRGLPQLRAAIANWYHKIYHVSVDPETEVLPLIGSKEGIMHISLAFLEPGTKVLVPDPGYPAYSVTGQLAGAEVIRYPLLTGSWWPDFDWLNTLDTSDIKLMWINYPHMPTGGVPTKKLFTDLINWAAKKKLLICNDNPYSLILNDGPPISLLCVPGGKDFALELNSLSKSHNMAGWRVGMLLGAETHINSVMKVKSNMDSGMFKGIQEAAITALNLDASWSNKLNTIYANRREAACRIMDLLSAKYETNQSGMFVWAKVPDSEQGTEKLTDEILYNAGVFITPGFIFGKGGSRYIRISLCSPTSTFETAFQRIKTYLDNRV
ncbi:MAG: aminotransferase class I/II-fold pyridoxal phosphate-dependent enzyme [Bacteroidota bacterium]